MPPFAYNPPWQRRFVPPPVTSSPVPVGMQTLPGMLPTMPVPMAPAPPVPPMPPPVAGLGLPALQRPPRQQPDRSLPRPISRKEERSVLGTVLGGVAALGNTLDLPFSAVRDVIGGVATGDWDQYNPIDQFGTAWWRDAGNRTSGRALNRALGWAGEEDTWGNFWGGLATEIATSLPASYITGPLGTVAKGSKIGTRAAIKQADDVAEATSQAIAAFTKGAKPKEILTDVPGTWTEGIRSGERGLLGMRKPFSTEQWIGWTPGNAAKDSKVANAIADTVDKFFYSSENSLLWKMMSRPIIGLRSLVSSSAGGKRAGILNGQYHRLADLRYANFQHLSAAGHNMAAVASKNYRQAMDAFTDVMKSQLGDSDKLPHMQRAFAETLHDVQTIKGLWPEYGELMDAARMTDVENEILTRLGNAIPENIRPASLEPMRKALGDYVVGTKRVNDYLQKQLHDAGIPTEYLWDLMQEYSPRYGAEHLGKLKDATAVRDNVYRHFPGGDVGLQQASRDPHLMGQALRQGKELGANRAQMYQWLRENADLPINATERGRKGLLHPVTREPLKGEALDSEYLLQRYVLPGYRDAMDTSGPILGDFDQAGRLIPGSRELGLDDLEKYWRESATLQFVKETAEEGAEKVVGRTQSRIDWLRESIAKIDPEKYPDGLFDPEWHRVWGQNTAAKIDKLATVRSMHELLRYRGNLGTANEITDGVPLAAAWLPQSRKALEAARETGDFVPGAGLTQHGLNKFMEDLGIPLNQAHTLYVPQNVAKAMRAYTEVIKPGKMSELTEMVDKLNALYRGWLTTGFGPLSVSFQTRNMASGIFQELTDAHLGFREIRKAKLKAIQFLRGKGDLDHLQEAIDSGALAGLGRIAEVVGEEGAEHAFRLPTKGSLGKLMGGPFKRAATEGKAWNPFAVRGWYKHPTKVKPGEKVPLSWTAEWGENLNNVTEFILRAGYFEGLRKAGYSVGHASQIVNKTHFNYRDLAKAEKLVGRRGLLFYSWLRKSVPHTLRKVFERPFGPKGQAILATTYPQREGNRSGWTPAFLRERGGFPVLGNNRAMSYLTSLGLPTEDLNMLKLRGSLTETARRTGESFISNFNPLATALLYEFPSGRQAYSGRELKHLRSRLAPYYKELTGSQMPAVLRRLEGVGPWSRAIGEVGKYVDKDTHPALRAVKILTGLRFSTYNPAKWRLIDAINAQEAELEQDETVRQYEQMYVPKHLRADAMPSTLQRLQRIKELQNMRTQLPR
jgi:hypothetical protein